jgi:hypothetical protein
MKGWGFHCFLWAVWVCAFGFESCDAKADPPPSVTFQWERSDDPRIEGEQATIRKIAPRHVQLCLRSVAEGFESSSLVCSKTIPLPEPSGNLMLAAGVVGLGVLVKRRAV